MVLFGLDKPILFVLSGVQGSGKTTFAKDLERALKTQLRNTQLISSDVVRKDLFGEDYEYDPKDNKKVFEEIDRRMFENKYDNIIYDATNLTLKGRAELYERMKYKYTVVVIQLQVGLDTLIDRNSIRNVKLDKGNRISKRTILSALTRLELPENGVDCDFSIVQYVNNRDFVNFKVDNQTKI